MTKRYPKHFDDRDDLNQYMYQDEDPYEYFDDQYDENSMLDKLWDSGCPIDDTYD